MDRESRVAGAGETQAGRQCDWLRLDLLDGQPDATHSPTSRESTSAIRGETQFGEYAILKTLGAGGMGVVYHARHRTLDREVAIKSLASPGLADPTVLARFQSELKIVGNLRHANIVQVYEAGLLEDSPYLVMEYVPGGTLKDLIQQDRPSYLRAAELMVSIARAVDWAHDQGVIHRDLKPSNILMAADGQPKVADFGVAIELEDTRKVTRTGGMVGTPVYMAPERLDGSCSVTRSGDIYSMGVVLHELLTGVVPFSGDVLSSVLLQVMAREALPLTTWDSAVPRDLDTICRKCLHKDEQRRYLTAGELADDLQRFLEDKPIRARPASRIEKGWRWCRREPIKASLSAGLATVVLGALLGLVWGFFIVSDVNRSLNTANADLTRSNRDLEAARQSAEEEHRRARATLEFMVESFRRPDPARDGKTLTVFELMQKASEKIGAQETLDPATRRSLLHAIGLTYLGLGEYGEAVEVFERADAVIQKHLDPDDLASLDTRHDLAVAYRFGGRYQDAIDLYEIVRDRRSELLGPDHADTLTTRNNLAAAYRAIGRKADAIDVYERVLEKRTETLGHSHPDTLTTLNDIACAYRSVERYDDAIRLFERALAEMQKQSHPETLMAISNLAVTYGNVGRSAEAIPLLEDIHQRRLNRLGEDHPYTLQTIQSLGHAHLRTGDFEKAIEYFSKLRDQHTKKSGPEHWHTLHAINDLAEAYRRDGKAVDAIPLHKFVLEVRLRKIGGEHPHTLVTMSNLAAAYSDIGKLKEAIEMWEVVRDVRETELGGDHPDTVRTRQRLQTAKRNIGKEIETTERTESGKAATRQR
jgi:serine/threonine protein kinase